MPIAVLLIVLAVLAGGLLRMAVKGQDAIARQASQTIASAAMNSEEQSTARLVRDYSWWNAAVENLIFHFNPAWVKDNLGWLHDNYGISRVFVFGPHRRHLYASLGAQRVALDDPAWKTPTLLEVVRKAAALPNYPSQSASAYVVFPDGVHLVSASKLLEEADKTGHPPYPNKGILVVSRRIDAAFLARIQNDFELPDLRLAPALPTDGDQTAMALRTEDGTPAAYIAWTPSRPGHRLLEWLKVPLRLAFLLVAGAIGVIVMRARRAGVALQEALDAKREAQTQLEFAAMHDHLTGLPNRALFLEHLKTALSQFERDGSIFAVHYLDLDGFKNVNDSLGHAAGDALLKEVAARLGETVRGADTVARFGGDEFAILQRDVGDRTSASLLAARVVDAVARPFELAEGTVHISISDGVAFSRCSADPEQIIKDADGALYRAKKQVGSRLQLHEPSGEAAGVRTPGLEGLARSGRFAGELPAVGAE
ncbi:MAG: diguanylate cyclase [Arenicellales bacterium]